MPSAASADATGFLQAQLPLPQATPPGLLLSVLLSLDPNGLPTPPKVLILPRQLPMPQPTPPGLLLSVLLAQLSLAQPTVQLQFSRWKAFCWLSCC